MTARMDQRSVRANNLALVFREVLERGPRSRATIAQDTGLNKTTISSLVAELIASGMLVETEVERAAKVGRPAQMVDINGARIMGIGLEMTGDYVAVCLKDLFGRVIAERYETVRNRGASEETMARRLGALAREVLRQWLAADAFLAGATIAVPGLVERDGSTVLVAPELALEHAALGKAVERELRELPHDAGPLRVRVEKAANLGALAELREGAGHDLREFAYLSGGAGVSAGIVVDGQLVRGAEGFAGEIGHLPMDPAGPACWCGGRGCFEVMVHESLLRLLGTERLASSPSDTMNEVHDIVAERVRAGEAAAVEALAELARRLGIGLAGLANLLNPRAIVLGGYFSVLSEWLLEPATAHMRGQLVAGDATEVQLRVAVLGGYAPLRGAALDALSRVLTDPRFPAQFGGRDEDAAPGGAAEARLTLAHRRPRRTPRTAQGIFRQG